MMALHRPHSIYIVLQETRGALDAAEMLVSQLQSAESSLIVAQVLTTSIQFSVSNRCTQSSKIQMVFRSYMRVHMHAGTVAEFGNFQFLNRISEISCRK
jgi:hypothetical protein